MIEINTYTLPAKGSYPEREGLLIKTPFNRPALQSWRTIPGRVWLRDEIANFVPVTSRREVWELLKEHHNGDVGTGPSGPFTVGAKAAKAPEAKAAKDINWGDFQYEFKAREKRTGCSCGSVEEYTKESDCFTCKLDA